MAVREVSVVDLKALSRQFRADWFELLTIVIVGPLIGLGIGYAAKALAPVVTAKSGGSIIRFFERRGSPKRTTSVDPMRQSGVISAAKAFMDFPSEC
jgi:hypothetical protein